MKTMTDTTRKAFEAWADNARPHQRLRGSTTDNYDYPLGSILFECWQAATLAAQDKRKPLTDAQIHERYKAMRTNETRYIDIYRDAEAAHGIKQ